MSADMSSSNEQRRSWERLPDETDAQWQAFRIYRDLGLCRTVVKAYREYAEKRGLSKDQPHTAYQKWTKQNNWKERAQEYDMYVDEQRRKMRQEKRAQAMDELVESAPDAAQTLTSIVNGDLQGNEALEALDDRVFLEMVKEILDRAGVSSPEELKIESSNESREEQILFDLSNFDVDELEQLGFGDGGEG